MERYYARRVPPRTWGCAGRWVMRQSARPISRHLALQWRLLSAWLAPSRQVRDAQVSMSCGCSLLRRCRSGAARGASRWMDQSWGAIRGARATVQQPRQPGWRRASLTGRWSSRVISVRHAAPASRYVRPSAAVAPHRRRAACSTRHRQAPRQRRRAVDCRRRSARATPRPHATRPRRRAQGDARNPSWRGHLHVGGAARGAERHHVAFGPAVVARKRVDVEQQALGRSL